MFPNKILVVEDDIQLLSLIEKILVSQNIEVTTQTNGEKVIQNITDSNPDLILLDLNMPEKDGIEVLMEVKKQNITTPIIVITGAADCLIKIASMYGVQKILHKPFSKDQILRHIMQV